MQRFPGIRLGGSGTDGGSAIVDVGASPLGSGFRFSTLPQSGLTIEAGHAVKLASFAEVQLAPADGKTVLLSTTGALPTASASLRGALFVVRGATGVADTLQVCLKSAADAYSWKVLATG